MLCNAYTLGATLYSVASTVTRVSVVLRIVMDMLQNTRDQGPACAGHSVQKQTREHCHRATAGKRVGLACLFFQSSPAQRKETGNGRL